MTYCLWIKLISIRFFGYIRPSIELSYRLLYRFSPSAAELCRPKHWRVVFNAEWPYSRDALCVSRWLGRCQDIASKKKVEINFLMHTQLESRLRFTIQRIKLVMVVLSQKTKSYSRPQTWWSTVTIVAHPQRDKILLCTTDSMCYYCTEVFVVHVSRFKFTINRFLLAAVSINNRPSFSFTAT
jgi:hypothetical protein